MTLWITFHFQVQYDGIIDVFYMSDIFSIIATQTDLQNFLG